MGPLPKLSLLLLAALSAPATPMEPKCPLAVDRWCWIELANQSGCHAWVAQGNSAPEWSGRCTGGLAPWANERPGPWLPLTPRPVNPPRGACGRLRAQRRAA